MGFASCVLAWRLLVAFFGTDNARALVACFLLWRTTRARMRASTVPQWQTLTESLLAFYIGTVLAMQSVSHSTRGASVFVLCPDHCAYGTAHAQATPQRKQQAGHGKKHAKEYHMGLTFKSATSYRALSASACMQGGQFADIAAKIAAIRKANGQDVVSDEALANHIVATRRWLLTNGIEESSLKPIDGMPARTVGARISLEQVGSLLSAGAKKAVKSQGK